jgi:hypothetical protein
MEQTIYELITRANTRGLLEYMLNLASPNDKKQILLLILRYALVKELFFLGMISADDYIRFLVCIASNSLEILETIQKEVL